MTTEVLPVGRRAEQLSTVEGSGERERTAFFLFSYRRSIFFFLITLLG
mgnify:FL=1